MASSRFLMPALLVLLATTALTGAASAQMRGQVGQPTDRIYDPGYTQKKDTPSATSGGGADATLDGRARAQASAQGLAGSSGTQGNVRAIVRKRTRAAMTLTRPPNRVVRPVVMPTGVAGGAAPLSPMAREGQALVAPGLTELPMARRKKPPVTDPYAPVGLRLGTLTVMPGVEFMAGYDTNPLRTGSGTKAKGSKQFQIAPDLSVSSDWSRHQLQIDLRGSYSYFPDVDNASRPTLDGKLTFRGDVSQDTTVNIELKEKLETQRPGSVDLTNAVKGRPQYYTHSGSAGVTQKIGYASVTATALVDRTTYENGTTYAGGTYDQQDRNYTSYGARLRGAYEITPGLTPFAEVVADTRSYDQAVDVSGYRRSSNGLIARAGTTFEFSRTLTGEVGVGWGTRHYDDTRLANLSGGLVDAALIWQASPLTKVTLKAASEFAETTTTGSSGAVSRKIGLDVAHDLLRNVTVTGSLGYTGAVYQGINRMEQTISSGLKLDYKIDRNFIVRGSYNYERAISEVAGNGYLSHTFLMGLRVQR